MIDPFKDAICKNVSISLDFVETVESRASYEIQSGDPSLDRGTADTYLEDGSFMLAFRTIRLLDHFQRSKLWKSDTAFVCRNDQRKLAFSRLEVTQFRICKILTALSVLSESITLLESDMVIISSGQLFQRRIRKSQRPCSTAQSSRFQL